jgi:P-type Cu+ transporter
MVGTGRGATRGILIKSGEALEAAHSIDTVILDKTGTLTTGRPRVLQVSPAEGYDEVTLLRLAAAAERYSEHPLGRAIVTAAEERGLPLAEAGDFAAIPGEGVRARVEGRLIEVGRQADSPRLAVSIDGVAAGQIEVGDTLKSEAAEAVRRLRALGLDVRMLTGDHAEAAERVARQVGIERVIAGVRPDGKVAEVKRLQAEGRRVAMVGDGINDAPALAQASLGIALASGSGVALEAGGITLMRDDLLGVAEAIELSRSTLRVIRQNLFWAFAYNTLAIPAAALGLLSPMIASAAMALSSLTVVGNSLRLR